MGFHNCTRNNVDMELCGKSTVGFQIRLRLGGTRSECWTFRLPAGEVISALFIGMSKLGTMEDAYSGRTARIAPRDAASRMNLQARRWLSFACRGFGVSV
jgi:hypothetical protein